MGAFSGIHSSHFFHLFRSQLEIKNTDIACNSLLLRGLRQYDQPVLYLKAQQDLSGVFVILLCQLLDNRMRKKLRVAVSQREVCFDLHIIFLKKRAQLPLLEERVALYLVDCRNCLKLRDIFLPDLGRHVADSDGP